MFVTVIMAGGKGERFWPKSRINRPKQLINLVGTDTMIQTTVKRVTPLTPPEQIFVVTGPDYAPEILRQLPELPPENIIVEPEGRNTAPCVGLAAAVIASKVDSEAVMFVLPADHLIADEPEFLKVLETAAKVAENGENLVTLGITPDRPETGYGYIYRGLAAGEYEGREFFHVQRFVEKPDLNTVKEYIASGEYFWNSGMFIWKASTILHKIKQFMPEMYLGLEKIQAAIDNPEFPEILKSEYGSMEKTSIDYGIMEKADNIYMVPGDCDWDDVGSWPALERFKEKDQDGNVLEGNVITVDASGCIVEAPGKLIAAVGIEDLIVIDTDDVTFICPKDKAQEVKALLQKVRERNLNRYL